MDCDLDTAVPDWLIEHPSLDRLFGELGIAEACGGKSLGYVCRERGHDPERVLRLIRERLETHPGRSDIRRG